MNINIILSYKENNTSIIYIEKLIPDDLHDNKHKIVTSKIKYSETRKSIKNLFRSQVRVRVTFSTCLPGDGYR